MYDLEQGKLTQEVEQLRWRMYKVLDSTNNIKNEVTGYDEDGYPIIKSSSKNKINLNSIKTFEYKDYKLIMEFIPEKNYKSISEALTDGSKYTDINDMINIEREYTPTFKIEKLCEKLHIKENNDKKLRLELYLSKYSDIYNKKDTLILSNIKKSLLKGFNPNFDMETLEFISNTKTVGTNPNLHYKYNNFKFTDIQEYGQYYLLGYECDSLINGDNIFEKYRKIDLDEKYDKKERR
jgi:hypothetical protein